MECEQAVLEFGYIFSGRSFGPADHIKFHPVSLFQGLEPLALDRGIVDKDIFAAILLNEAESFRIIEPFYRSLCHCRSSLCRRTLTCVCGPFFEYGFMLLIPLSVLQKRRAERKTGGMTLKIGIF